MEQNIYPGYEQHLGIYRVLAQKDEEARVQAKRRQREELCRYALPDGMRIQERTIPGGDGQDMVLRIYTPAGLPDRAPILLEIHGGGWVGGDLDIDNARCVALAAGTPAIVVGVDYRLTVPGGIHFPAPLMDCHAALTWVHRHARELGGDGERIALHGTSAGGSLCAGLALYLRDHGGPRLSLVVLNCPALDIRPTLSKWQNREFSALHASKREEPGFLYAGGYDGVPLSYYAFPGLCPDLEGLPPHSVIVGELDPRRDEGVRYAQRLWEAGVPCQLLAAPRVGHGFCTVNHPLTHWVHRGICASLRRVFGMEIREF